MVSEAAVVPGANQRNFGISAKQKLYDFLRVRPAGADATELIGLLLSGAGSDPELGARLVRTLLDEDPNFVFDAETALWSLRKSVGCACRSTRRNLPSSISRPPVARPGPAPSSRSGRGKWPGDASSNRSKPWSDRNGDSAFHFGLTSISNEMVRQAPRIEEVLPAFRDFLGDSVMVAHNAAFDFSFLDFEFRRIFGIGLNNPVLCTLRMARRFMPSLKRKRLDALAEHFGLSTEGRHRGLGDARMAAEILSIFIEMAAKMGLTRLDRLIDDHQRGAAGRRIERHIAPEEIAALPSTPGVYLMRNERGDLLYIGKARRLKDRVGSYFNAAVNAKTADLISHVWKIETRVTRSSLEAALVEAQIIREFKPPFNRMLKWVAPAFFIASI